MHKGATITLGPLLFNWAADQWSDFYARIADEAPVDRVCLGETICSKRLPFYIDRIPEAIERLQRAGKAVILSSLALVTLLRERRMCADLVAAGDIEIEINDLTILVHLGGGRRFTVGPLVNVYNEGTLAWLAVRGASLICLPPELPFASIQTLAQAAAQAGVESEIWAFGRVPLAISGRCYHARVHGLAKDNCQFVCGEDLDGLKVETLDDEDFLAINGVQTLSFTYCSLLADLCRLQAAGVTSFRLSPHCCDMVAVAKLFRQALDGALDGAAATQALAALLPAAHFSNGFLDGSHGAASGHGQPSHVAG
ncbi:ubiquinone anaerobic biosynthesis protein UbiV [Sphingosinicella rhizophila]|uniref:Ubiquinone biosynthesis protein UbiV n=1 Tax=Sphingosinicella rhizophila TaxID=3050082 RepID=A0ABU3QBU7_9SPHN|nr:U32 family peptidase [Sphingosinicella sp. GR2756]MDT9600873.1 U32 family peptidase [Sphingosinicella sp. GR2756]